MAITEEIYERCNRCLQDAAALLQALSAGNTFTPAAVTARRTAADIAADVAVTELQKAFITPIDREDLWLLWDGCEAVLRAAEDTALTLYCAGRGTPSCCAALLRQASACAAAPEVPHSLPAALRAIREAERSCLETERTLFADSTARRVCEAVRHLITACERVITQTRYCTLKNT